MGTDDNGVIHPFYLTSDIEGGYGTKSDYEAQVRSSVNLFKETHVYLCIYMVTHNGYDFRDDCTEIVRYIFLLSGFCVGRNWFISVLNHLIN